MSSNTLHQFAGVHSVKPEHITMENYFKAQTMIEDGYDMSSVLRETGWFKGADGKMRYELSDSDAEINNDTLSRLASGDLGATSLSFVLKHQELYSAYPMFRNYSVIVDDFTDNPTTQGYWDATNKVICLNRGTILKALGGDHTEFFSEMLMDTLLHEIQHGIQTFEGFAKGANTTDKFVLNLRDALTKRRADASVRLTRFEDEMSKEIHEANELQQEAMYSRLFYSSSKLIQYAISDSPSRVKRHIENHASWLYHSIFRTGDKSGSLQKAAYDQDLDWYNMPRSNRKGEKTEFLRKWAINTALLYKEQIPKELLNKFEDFEGNFKAFSDKISIEASRKLYELRLRDTLAADLRRTQTEVSNYEKLMANFEPSGSDVRRNRVQHTSQHEVYRRSYGEQEANNTAARRKMSHEERRAKGAWVTQELSDREVFVYTESDMSSNETAMQVKDKVLKGSVTFNGDKFASILLNKMADLSTIVHEGAHVYLEALTELSKAAPDSLAAKDLSTILDWLEVDGKDWMTMSLEQRRDHHESFAYAFEAHIAGGRTSSKLESIFQGFKSWILDIYKSLSNLPETKPLTPNVHKLFDQLVDRVDSVPSEFTAALATSISNNSAITSNVALAGAAIVNASFDHLSSKSGLSRTEFDQIFKLDVIGDKQVEKANRVKNNLSI